MRLSLYFEATGWCRLPGRRIRCCAYGDGFQEWLEITFSRLVDLGETTTAPAVILFDMAMKARPCPTVFLVVRSMAALA